MKYFLYIVKDFFKKYLQGLIILEKTSSEIIITLTMIMGIMFPMISFAILLFVVVVDKNLFWIIPPVVFHLIWFNRLPMLEKFFESAEEELKNKSKKDC